VRADIHVPGALGVHEAHGSVFIVLAVLLPLALWEPFGTSWNHVAVVPATTLVAIFFFGIEELAVQLEEPFSILPLLKLCDGVWDSGVELYNEPEPIGSRVDAEAVSVRL